MWSLISRSEYIPAEGGGWLQSFYYGNGAINVLGNSSVIASVGKNGGSYVNLAAAFIDIENSLVKTFTNTGWAETALLTYSYPDNEGLLHDWEGKGNILVNGSTIKSDVTAPGGYAEVYFGPGPNDYNYGLRPFAAFVGCLELGHAPVTILHWSRIR